MSEVIVDESGIDEAPKTKEFTRLERMLLFAVVSECERCISSEGVDCLQAGQRRVDCPFYSVREEYKVHDIEVWRERVG
jgi:hypothetical protein